MFMPAVFHENLFDDLFDPFWNDGALERAMNREERETFGKRGANMMKTDVKQTENGYDVAVQMDGDGQHDPAYLMEIVQPVLDGECDMCIGSRFIKCEGFQTSFMRRVGIRFLSWLIHILCGQRILDVTSGFRATGPQLTAYFAEHYASDYPEPEAILAATLAGFRVGEAPVVMKERQGGVSSIRSFKSAYYMIKVSLSLIIDRLSIKKIHQPKSK